MEYDLASQVVRAVTLDPGGDTEETTYTFDVRGNLVKEERLGDGDDCGSVQPLSAAAAIARASAGGVSDQGASKGGGAGNGQGNGSGGGGGSGNDEDSGDGNGGGNGNQPGHGKPADPGANGKRKAVTTYRYDFEGHLVEVAQGDGTEAGIARYVRFTYDGTGNKLALDAWAKAPGNGNHYGWDKDWKEGMAVQGKSGNNNPGGKPSKDPVRELSLSLRYAMDPLARSPEALTVTGGLDQTTAYLYGLGRLAAYDSAGSPAYFLTDHTGSVRQIASPGGSIIERYSYSPYGFPLGGDLDPGARLATGNLFGFTGAEHDPAFALVDLGARTYSPGLARFLTPDPFAAGVGMALPGNPYSYTACNPLRYVDPSGLIEERLGLDQYSTPGELLFWNVVETVGAASVAMLVVLAAPAAGTALGIAALAVGGALTASHLTAVVEDWDAYLQGDYGSVGGNDPVYAWAAERFGPWSTVALGIAEGVFWAGFPRMTGLTPVGAPVVGAGHESVNVWHATTSSSAAESILSAIDPKFFNPKGRYGPAFYVSGTDVTAALEVGRRGTSTFAIRYRLDLLAARVLDLTDRAIAARWGFTPGASLEACQAIGAAARASGYSVVIYPSYAGPGVNYAILEGFNKLLKPLMIVPIG